MHSKTIITYGTLQSAGDRIRYSVFNRRTRCYCENSEIRLVRGCARVAHYVTAGWRNFSRYRRPLRQYDVWFSCSGHREALTTAPTADVVHKQGFRVEGWSTYFSTEQVGRLRYVTAVDGRLKRFPSVAWFAHPWASAFIMWRHYSITYSQSFQAINGLLAAGRKGILLCGCPS